MKNLRETLKKPAIVLSLIGALGIGVGILSPTTIGLKKQNDYLFNKYIETGKLYTNLVVKHINLREDTLKTSIKHSLELISLIRDKLELAYRFDSLQKSYTNFAEEKKELYLKLNQDIDSLQEDYTDSFIDFFEKIALIKDENDFLKKYNHYLDSLLLRCESDKMLQDIK
jgi:hypothetical protein